MTVKIALGDANHKLPKEEKLVENFSFELQDASNSQRCEELAADLSNMVSVKPYAMELSFDCDETGYHAVSPISHSSELNMKAELQQQLGWDFKYLFSKVR